VKHTSTKLERVTPKHIKYSSKVENSSDKYRSKHLNTSKLSSHERQSERNSSRKRERNDRNRYRGTTLK